MLGGLQAFVSSHKALALGGAAGVAALAIHNKRKGGATSPTAAAQGTPTAVYPGAGGTFDSTANDVYNSIEPQLEGLAAALNGLGGGAQAANPAGALALPKQILSGSGYIDITREQLAADLAGRAVPAPPPVPGYDGSSYVWVMNPDIDRGIPGSVTRYFQPSPGTFVATGGGPLAPGTPVFIRQSQQGD